MKPYSQIEIAVKYLTYLLNSKSRYRVHSPFLFDLIQDCFREKKWYYALDDLKAYQNRLDQNSGKIIFREMGAGKNYGETREVKVRGFYKKTKRPFKYYRLLFNLSRYLQPRVVLEVGTGLGLSTLPLAGGSKLAKIHTLEGNQELSEFAKTHLKGYGYANIRFKTGNFSSILPELLTDIKQIDLAFLDGNHTYEATMDYFNHIKSKLHENSLVILDDIHWSPGMEKAWKEIYSRPEVTISIDLFFFGLVFFKSGTEKQHFILRY